MAINYEQHFLSDGDPVAGVTTLERAPAWFAPHDDSPVGYWKKPDGWVTLNQYGPNGTEAKLDRGFQRLGKYGSYASSAIANLKDPLLPLVMAGGLAELPAEQIKQIGWHRPAGRDAKRSHREVDQRVTAVMQQRQCDRTEALLAVMPQLKGFDLTDYSCAACPGRWFPTQAGALNHEAVMHKESVQSRSIGNAVAAAQQGTGDGTSAALLTLLAQQTETIAALSARLEAMEQDKAPPPKK